MFAIPGSTETERDHNVREGPATLECLGVALRDLADADTKAIASLLLEDADQITAMQKDKRREEDPPPDDEVAWKMFSHDLKLLLSQVQGHIIPLSTTTAQKMGETAPPLLDRLLVQSEPGDGIAPPGPVSTAGPSSLPQYSATRSISYGSVKDAAEDVDSSTGPLDEVESSDDPLSSVLPAKQQPKKCTACMDTVGTAGLQFPCKHFYHVDCATQLFEQSIKNESLWPPRCCKQTVPTEMVTQTLSQSSTAIFLEKFRERSTENPLYCPVATCSSFIGQASSMEDRARVVCPKCGIAICTACKEVDHPLEDICSTDIDGQQVLALAQDKGWKRCPGCHRMVELTHGCYHMTCVCGKQFCYLCRIPWKNCSCRQSDVARLVGAAQPAVENRMQAPPHRQRLVRRS